METGGVTIVQFGEWMPDVPVFGSKGVSKAENVIPAPGGYGPFKGISAVSTNALDAKPTALINAQSNAGDWLTFAGDATKLYRLTGGTGGSAWSNVSKSGNYSIGSGNRWAFAQFGTKVIATAIDTFPQVFDTTSASLFSDLVTTHKAKYIAVVRDFVFTGNTWDATDGTQPTRVRWSAVNDPTSFAISPQTMSDYQNIEGAGDIKQIFGGETCTVFFDHGIARLSFVGTPVIFQVDMISTNQGLVSSGAATQFQNTIFFLDYNGFFTFDGRALNPIGATKINKFFWDDVDKSRLDEITSVVDHERSIVMWSYTAQGASSPNRMIVYHYQLGRWSLSTQAVDLVSPGRGVGYTLEQLNNINTSIDALTVSLDSPTLQGGSRTVYCFSGNKLYDFSGSNLAAVIDTGELQPHTGRRSTINRVRPITDAAAFTAQVGSRRNTTEATAFSSASSPTSDGTCPLRAQNRYHRVRLNIPSATTWTEAQGVEFEAVPLGAR